MLKYKDFVEILIESSINKPVKAKWQEALKEAYIKLFGLNQYFVKPSSKHPNEIMRADFILSGHIEESEDNLIKFLSSSAGLLNNDYSLKEVGIGDSGSGSFTGFVIEFKKNINWFGKNLNSGIEYKIVNAKKQVNIGGETKSALISDKETTPASLELNGYWPTQESIKTKTIQKIKEKINNQDCQEFMIDLVETVCSYKGNINSVVDLMKIKSEIFSIKANLSKYKNIIDSQSINNIKKDFGEVLGGIFMFSLNKTFKNGLEFPKESNTQLVDFYFDKMSVSSKAGTVGAKPSSSGYKNAIEKHMKESNYVLNQEESTAKGILDTIATPEKEPKNTEYLTKKSSSGIFVGMVNLFDKILLTEGNNRWLYFRRFCETPINQFNRDSIIKTFINQRDENNLHKFIQGFLKISKFNIKDTESKGGDVKLTHLLTSANNEKECSLVFDKILKEERYDILIGLILYYCSVDLKSILNQKYSEILSILINKSVKVNQLNLQINIKENEVSFKIRSMSFNGFEFGSLNGISTWMNSMIPISMKR